MADCCQDKGCELNALRANHSRVLWIVLIINAAMFVVEGVAGWLAHSTALLADALDMLGDALVYGSSLFVLARSVRWQTAAAACKGMFMLAFGLGVLTEAAYKVVFPVLPGAGTMGIVGFAALAANAVCFALLYRHRADNLNMSSTWICSRNDLIANLGVLTAAAATYLAGSQWPDVVVGTLVAAVFLNSAARILAQSVSALRSASVGQPRAPRPPVPLNHSSIRLCASTAAPTEATTNAGLRRRCTGKAR